jgi:hypothetical protein
VIAATHVLVANRLPISCLRDLLLDVNQDWRDRLLANVADPLVASFFHDASDQYNPDERKHLRGSTMRRLFDRRMGELPQKTPRRQSSTWPSTWRQS